MSTKRNTPQRQIILDALQASSTHPSAEELYLEIQRKHNMVGKSTIYRNLRQLVEDGIIAQIITNNVVRYDKSAVVHYHFICDLCGKIFDLKLKRNDSLNEIVKTTHGFNVVRHKLEFFGTCSDCATT